MTISSIITGSVFGKHLTELKRGDQMFFDAINENAVADASLRLSALANTKENFGYAFRKALEGLIVARLDQNEEILWRCLNEPDVRELVGTYLLKQVYEQVQTDATG